ncbi:MAG: sigma-70 family RNA polymerase sigma factor [Sphingobacteriia bacterium]|nr:sigma-70 family RNA polymerase sigma factor [Sphingobacteriia bacterium]
MEVNSNFTDKANRDYLLVQAALNQGDQRAYAELMNNYRDSLYFLLLKMTNDPVDAEDLTIEAFGKAFRNLHQYTPNFAFSTWLFKIASNNCIDFMRKKSKRLTSPEYSLSDDLYGQEYGERIASEAPDPEESIISKQKSKLMRDIVDRLKPHYKLLVEMRYFKEMSYEEIAVELNLPLGTVKAQLFRARDFLYQVLKDHSGNL